MDSTTDFSSATPSDNGISAAADAFQDLLTPGHRGTDEDEHQEGAQDDKPTATSKDEPEGNEGEDSEGSEGEESEEGEDEESESEDEQGEESQEEHEEEQLYTVTVDGKEEQVSLEELAKGYQREASYTRKSQTLAEERRAFEAEREETSALRDQYSRGLEQLKGALEQLSPKEPDWETLRATDPIEFAAQWADHQRRQAMLERIDQEREAARQQEEREFTAKQQKAVKAGREWLLQQVPEWTDAEKQKADRNVMAQHAMKVGFSAEELKAINDPRAILLIRQAALYAQLQEKKATLIKPVKKPATPTRTPVLKPGSVKGSSKTTSELTRAKQRLAKTGSVRDAADVFSHVIGGGRTR